MKKNIAVIAFGAIAFTVGIAAAGNTLGQSTSDLPTAPVAVIQDTNTVENAEITEMTNWEETRIPRPRNVVSRYIPSRR